MKRTFGLVLTALIVAAPGAAFAAGDPVKGKAQFAKCAMCHSLQPGKAAVGPSLAGVIGRKAGSMPGYKYSKAMASSGLTWTPETVSRYITNPRAMVPGGKMMFAGMPRPDDRANLIAYLRKPQ